MKNSLPPVRNVWQGESGCFFWFVAGSDRAWDADEEDSGIFALLQYYRSLGEDGFCVSS